MNDLIVKVISRLTIPFIQLYGIFIIMHGHLSPGGGFAGGAILGASIILLTLAFGLEGASKKMPHHVSKVIESSAILLLLALGMVGIVTGNNFLTNADAGFDLGQTGRILSAGFIPIATMAIGMKVASTLITLFHTIIEED
ncbi:MnhB domain-containing protein [Proteinivorax hydrogeniformans]|uniref:MnhB domain-containing protein n=2 Tax=Proteinivorax TaxID=1491776 RepID=A0AAU7VL13_9FIRM